MRLTALSLSLLCTLLCSAVVHAALDPSQVKKAAELWDQREYSPEGAKKAEQAAAIYEQQAGVASNSVEKGELLAAAARGLYFRASQAVEDEALGFYSKAIALADQGLANFGISSAIAMDEAQYKKLALPNTETDVVGHLLYERGASFGQWLKWTADSGILGKLEAMRRFSELETTCSGLLWLNRTEINFHGYERILGYALYGKGVRLGGSDKDRGYQMLESGFKATFNTQINTSIYGYNTTFLAEALKGKGQTARAKQILNDLLKVNPASMAPGFEKENIKAQADAKDLLKKWN